MKRFVALEVNSTGLHQVLAITDDGLKAWGEVLMHIADCEIDFDLKPPIWMEGHEALMMSCRNDSTYWCVLEYGEDNERFPF